MGGYDLSRNSCDIITAVYIGTYYIIIYFYEKREQYASPSLRAVSTRSGYWLWYRGEVIPYSIPVIIRVSILCAVVRRIAWRRRWPEGAINLHAATSIEGSYRDIDERRERTGPAV